MTSTHQWTKMSGVNNSLSQGIMMHVSIYLEEPHLHGNVLCDGCPQTYAMLHSIPDFSLTPLLPWNPKLTCLGGEGRGVTIAPAETSGLAAPSTQLSKV